MRLQEKYNKEIVSTLKRELGVDNSLAVPRLKCIIVNCGISEEQGQKEALENMADQLAAITGQRSMTTHAKKSIAGFKIRIGDPIGLKVSLHGQKMYDFLEKFLTIALPRVKDFQGTKRTAFDGHGNYAIGLSEQLIFPEINYDRIDKVRGLEVIIVTTAEHDKKALRLLELLGMPFEKEKNGKKI